ncbi:MAG: aspartate aminotransferase family protein [Acholeplasmataceae bacterium]
MLKDDQRYILNVYQRLPITITKGEGSYVFDDQGQRYLDMFAGIAVNALGHQHPVINEAILSHMHSFLHLSNYFATASTVALAKCLVEETKLHQVFFSNSGTEAIEASIKLARKWGSNIASDKTDIIALSQGFHGRTSGGMALTDKPEYKTQFAPLLPGIKHCKKNDIKALEDTINDQTCALFIEVVQGEGGVHLLDVDYVKKMVELAKKHHVLIVADEIQSGMMRTGKLFAYQHYDLVPDIITAAKALGGGLPLGAMIVSEPLSHVFKPGDHGSTFGGNPMAAALGLALIKEVLKPTFIEQLNTESAFLFQELNHLKSKYPHIITDVRGCGMMIGVDVGVHAQALKALFIKHHILINVTSKTVIRLLPPLNIPHDALVHFIYTFNLLLESL